MTVSEILRSLHCAPDEGEFSHFESALRSAIDHRAAIVPELIAAIDRVSDDPVQFLDRREDCFHVFAIYLLAHFRERRAVDPLLRFFSLPGELALDLTGDLVIEHGAAVLASVCGADDAPLHRLIHDELVNEYVRHQAIDALLVQALWCERSRDAVIDDLRRLFQTLPRPGHAFVWAALAGAVCDFQAVELVPEARQAFAEGLVDETMLDAKWLEKSLFRRPGKDLTQFRRRNARIDAVAAISRWNQLRLGGDDSPPDWDEKPNGGAIWN